MKIICICNTGEAYKNAVMPVGFFETSEFGIEVGKEFIVMGIVLFENLIMYLIDENGKPGWYPYQLFRISDNALSNNWHFRVLSQEESTSVQAIWGYYELCFQKDYYDKLLDGDEESLQIYFKRKNELSVDEYSTGNR